MRPTSTRSLFAIVSHGLIVGILFWGTVAGCFASQSKSQGLFENHADIGNPQKTGSSHFEATNDSYRVAGGGENMWFGRDSFHFLWKQMSGDLRLSARIKWEAPGGNPHRKACLMIRQTLDPDSPYIDAVLHGDGLTSLQFREEKGGPTREVQSNSSGPAAIGIVRRGEFYILLSGGSGVPLHPSGGTFKLKLTDPVYVGLGVCAHDEGRLETVRFSEVSLSPLQTVPWSNLVPQSTLEVVDIASKDRRAIFHLPGHFEAPNWSRDGSYLLFNMGGRIYRLPARGGHPVMVDTDFANRCNNDHGISPDGTQLVISDQSQNGGSRIYILPITGGTPRLVTPLAPSYWHGWSPDGKRLSYCAERDGEYDIYTISTEGGPESRLTSTPGLDDGAEYAADGRYIYFNSERSGAMQIWRMRPDGSNQEQVTNDQYNNWFPHPSPDGKWLVFLSYAPEIKGHPENKDVQLRLMSLPGGDIQVLARLFGGQGTINVPSWSPDSRQIAFVSYYLAPRE